MMHIICKRVYEKAEEKDGRRILVDRIWPRGIRKENLKGEWWKEIAPSAELRKQFHNGQLSFEQFSAAYEKELSCSEEALNFRREIREEIKRNNVTFLFSSKNFNENNAVVLKNWIEK